MGAPSLGGIRFPPSTAGDPSQNSRRVVALGGWGHKSSLLIFTGLDRQFAGTLVGCRGMTDPANKGPTPSLRELLQ